MENLKITEEEMEELQDTHEDLLIWLSDIQQEAQENAMLKEEDYEYRSNENS